MRTFLYRYEIGSQRGVLRVDAKCATAAAAWAKLKVERQSQGLHYFIWAIN
jgi:hypothetical protein